MTTLEKIARAIARQNCLGTRMTADAIECQVEGAWDMWVPEARAALEALMEPSEAMTEGGWYAHDCDHPKCVFVAMIHAALNEVQP